MCTSALPARGSVHHLSDWSSGGQKRRQVLRDSICRLCTTTQVLGIEPVFSARAIKGSSALSHISG